jgi:chromosome segregation ATPase
MKNFQRNLFVLIAIALCGTCTYQWYLQGNQRNIIEKQNQAIYDNSVAIQGLTNSIKLRDDQISQLQDRLAQLKQAGASRDQQVIAEKREMARLQSAADLASNEIVRYKTVVSDLEDKINKAYEGEKQLAAQRDEFVKKLNDSITARNDLTSNYNALVDRFNKLQSAPAPAAK